MNIIVSNNAIEYSDFIKVAKLQEVLNIKGKIDFLIYHKSNESDDEKVRLLTLLKDVVEKLVYIRNIEDCDKAIQMIVLGSGGKYFDDEFFLESSSELKNLIENLGEVTAIAELGGVNVVSDFFNRYLNNGSSNFNKEYLMVVKNAVSGMLAEYKAKDLELLQLSETATEIFANSASLISKMEEEKENLKSAVMTLKEARDSIVVQPTVNRGPSVLFFPQVSYIKEKNIIKIKEIGYFPRLTSFSLGFRIYLDRIKYVRPKLIIIMPVGEQYEDLYKEYNWVTQLNSKTMDVYYHDVVFTNFPTREVLFRLLDDVDYDTFIIVDRLKSTHQHILNSKGGIVKYAVGSVSFIEKLKLKLVNCFLPKNKDGSLFNVIYDESYPEEIEQRERYYLREYQSAYEILNTVKR